MRSRPVFSAAAEVPSVPGMSFRPATMASAAFSAARQASSLP